MKQILFVAYQDFANVSTDIADAINLHVEGWEARVCSCTPHPFDYSNKHDLDYDYATDEEKRGMEEWIEGGIDILVWAEEGYNMNNYYSFHHGYKLFASTILFGRMHEIFQTAKCFIFHAGGTLREFPEVYNNLDFAAGFHRQIVSPDLWRCTKDLDGIVCFGKPFEVDLDEASYLWRKRSGDSIVICHSPTNYHFKGTAVINEALERVLELVPNVEYRQLGGPVHRNEHLPHDELREQRQQCHIYIDQYSDVGGIGMSSFEAMADGMITLCSFQKIPSEAWSRVGLRRKDCPVVELQAPSGDRVVDVCNLVDVLVDLCSKPMGYLESRGMCGAFWVQRHFAPSVFAQKFLDRLLAS